MKQISPHRIMGLFVHRREFNVPTARQIIDSVRSVTNTKMIDIVERLNNLDDKTTIQSLSNKMQRDSMKLSDVEKILNTMNYTLQAIPIMDTMDEIKIALLPHLSEDELEEFMKLLSDPRVEYQDKITLRNKLFHTTTDPVVLTKEFIIEMYERLHNK